MKEKLKLISVLLTICGVGIVLILGSWLYGTYSQYVENTAARAERILFDAIQDYVQEQRDILDRNEVLATPMTFLEKQLIDELTNTYPGVSADSLSEMIVRIQQRLLPSDFAENRPFFPVNSPPPPSHVPPPIGAAAPPQHLVPGFLFDQLTFDSTSYATINDKVAGELAANGLENHFKLDVVTLKNGDFLTREGHVIPISQIGITRNSTSKQALSVRPFLINAQQGQFITITLNLPWAHVIRSLNWQLTLSVCLVVTTLGCISYLFHTIFKQNRLATLRKTFVNNMTHELRSPVSTVYSAIQALQNYTTIDETEKRDMFQQIAKEELEHLSALIDTVLQVSESNHILKKQLNFERVDMEQLISKCMATATITTTDRNIKFSYENHATHCVLLADQLHIRNVVTNLLDNAVKYQSKNIRVTTRDSQKGELLEIIISDDGIGIPKPYQELIFEPFFRIQQDNSSHHSTGFGLGLAYVKQIVTQHNGTVKLNSKSGLGSTFTIQIPKSNKI